ncbi:MAG: glucose/arabinose dehydrogenase, partial [Glaciecola sp.]
TQVEVASDGRVIWAERGGAIKMLTSDGVPLVLAQLTPAGNACPTCAPEPDYLFPYDDPAGSASNGEVTPDRPQRLGVGGFEEGGLHGLLLDDEFAENGLLYVYYSVPNTRREVATGVYWGDFALSSLVMDPTTNLIDLATEEVLLTVPAEWDHCCHYGGDIDYLPDGTLLLTTGDDVEAASSGGYGPRDESGHWLNAELTSANPADRRGKILRLREDGSVPDGSIAGENPNPFIGMEGYNPYIEDSAESPWVGENVGTPGDGWIEFDPYIYAMGFKQPFRAAVMPNGDLYTGDVGPDAGSDDPERGPRGFEEINRVPLGGGTHYGWPRCQGPNWAYMDVDWSTLDSSGPLDCSDTAAVARPVGTSEATVTGMTGADIYYANTSCDGSDGSVDYPCDQWPTLGTGSKTSEPTFYYPPNQTGDLALPQKYRDRLWSLEWSRNYIVTIPVNPVTGDLDLRDETFDLVEPAGMALAGPIDAEIGPDGAVYVVEYGVFFYAQFTGRLSRISAAQTQPAPETEPEPAPAPSTAGEDGSAAPKSADATLPATGAGLSTAAVFALLGAVGTRRRRRVLP